MGSFIDGGSHRGDVSPLINDLIDQWFAQLARVSVQLVAFVNALSGGLDSPRHCVKLSHQFGLQLPFWRVPIGQKWPRLSPSHQFQLKIGNQLPSLEMAIGTGRNWSSF